MFSKITSWRHSKFIAFALAVAVFLSAFYGLAPVLNIVEAAGEDDAASTVGYWDGTTPDVATAFADQTGKGDSAANPYEVTTGAQLYAATRCADAGVYFKLMNDIVLQKDAAGLTKVQTLVVGKGTDTQDLLNWAFASAVNFKSHFDGNFKTVSGLYLSSASGAQGLFRTLYTPSSITNLTIKDVYARTAGDTGAMAGSVTRTAAPANAEEYKAKVDVAVVKGCKVENVNIKITSGEGAAGFFGGVNRVGLEVTDCIFDIGTGTLDASESTSANHYIGGLFGMLWGIADPDYSKYDSNKNELNRNTGVYITHFASVGAPISSQNTTQYCNNGSGWVYMTYENPVGFYADTAGVTISGGYLKILDNANMKGIAAYASMPEFTPANGWVVLEEGATPIYVGADNLDKYDYLKVPNHWTGDKTVTVDSLKGSGTSASDPKLIYNGAELYAAVNSNTATYFKLMEDIELQAPANMSKIDALLDGGSDNAGLNNWDVSSTFIGHFDGNFKTISGLYLNATSTKGFFAALGAGASVSNLTIKDSVYKSTSEVAALTGKIGGAGSTGVTISGCRVENCRIETTANVAAGFIGNLYTSKVTITNCAFVMGEKGYMSSANANNCAAIYGDHWSNSANDGYGTTINTFLSLGQYPARDEVWDAAAGNPYLINLSTVYTDISDSSSKFTRLTTAELTGDAAYKLVFKPENGWIVLAEGAAPVYVGAENVSKYDYLPVPWDGTVDITLNDLKGSGTTASDPKLIYTAEELYVATRCTTATYFKLMNDINIQSASGLTKVRNLIKGDTTDVSGLVNWAYTAETKFISQLDGNFKTISGLYISATSGTDQGLIQYLGSPASISNLTIRDSYYKTTGAVGGMAGMVRATDTCADTTERDNKVDVSSVTGCRVEDCYIESTGSCAGGFFGVVRLIGLEVTDCLYNKGTGQLIANTNYGGFNGTMDNMRGQKYDADKNQKMNNYALYITRFATIGAPICTNAAEFYVSNEQGWTAMSVEYARNVYTDNDAGKEGNLCKLLDSSSLMKGDVAYENMPGFTPSMGWVVLEEGAVPTYVGADNVADYDYLTPVWNGTKTVALSALAGEGTGEKPYKVSTGSELYAAITNTTAGKVFTLLNDINLNNVDWNAASTNFTGTINGNDYTIYNLKSNDALIPTTTDVTINNLHLRDVNINAYSAAGFVSNATTGVATFNGCSLKDFTINCGGISAGFILDSSNPAVINNCLVVAEEGSLVGTEYGTRGFAKNATFTNSIVQGYAPTWSSSTPGVVYPCGIAGMSGTFDTAKAFKAALTAEQKANLVDYFYWDNVSDNVPMLRGASCAVVKDVDGDETLTTSDAISLKEILLSDTSLTQLKADNFNDLDEIDVTDVAALYYATKIVQ